MVKHMGPKSNPLNTFDLLETSEPALEIPPKPDSNITLYFPLSETHEIESSLKTYACIWPSYIDSNKGTNLGRKISKSHAIQNPTVLDISEVLQSMGIRHALQPHKGYPRDTESRWDNPGRVLYDKDQMRNVSGIYESISQREFCRIVAGQIDLMPGRKERLIEADRLNEEKKRKAMEEKRIRAILTSKQLPASGATKRKAKKKDKSKSNS